MEKLEKLQNEIIAHMQNFMADAAKPSKAARQRQRKATLEIAKLGKQYRALSLEEDRK